jgi:hypothetical protein
MADAVWVHPELRCTMEYTEKTEHGNIGDQADSES